MLRVVIPARLNSERLSEKVLAKIEGMEMVIRTAIQASKSRADSIVVATDSPRVMERCRFHRVGCVMTSADIENGTLRCAEAADVLNFDSDDVVVNIQADEPLIDPNLIDKLFTRMEYSKSLVATVAVPIEYHEDFFNPSIVKLAINQKGNAMYFSRAPIPFDRDSFVKLLSSDAAQIEYYSSLAWKHVGVYAYRRSFLEKYRDLESCDMERCEMLEQLRILYHGFEMAVETISDLSRPHLSVDTEEDLERVRRIVKESNKCQLES